MSRHKKTLGYNNPKNFVTRSIGNLVIPPTKNLFIKDPAKLAYLYDNLIKKLGKQFSQDFSTYDEDEDLFAYIKEAFIELAIEYDPYSGVDFPGYIAKKLPLRIKYSYISKKFLQKKRMVLLRSGDYSINDLLDLIQDHGEGQVTTDKENRISSIRRVPKIDFSFKERIRDIVSKIPMDKLDQIIFVCFIRGFGRFNYVKDLVHDYSRKHHLSYSNQDIHMHMKTLKKRLRNYYLQIDGSPVILKRKH